MEIHHFAEGFGPRRPGASFAEVNDRDRRRSTPGDSSVNRADASHWAVDRSGGQPPVEHVLAVYGTLRPGESNFGLVADIDGFWFTGTIRGELGVRRTGHYRGFPAFVIVPDGPAVPVAVLVSAELPAHWERLDRFEGPGYRRTTIDVMADPGSGAPLARYRAYVYESVDDGGP